MGGFLTKRRPIMARHEVTPFNYNGNNLSTITDPQGEIWFVAKEVAEILDYKDATELTKRLDDYDKQNLLVAGFGNRGVICINESGLYQATLESTKPEVKHFKKWVTSEVLPSIR
jgi:prophage antirepressor-like protein